MVFSFNHSPIISSFAVDNKGRYGEGAEKKCSNILLGAHVMMVMTVMFFVFSCVLSLSPADWLLPKNRTSPSCPTWPTTSITRLSVLWLR